MVELADRTDAATIRAEVTKWLDENWDPKLSLTDWRGILCDSGWGMPMWPVEWYGKAYTKDQARVVAEVFEERQIPGLASGGIGPGMGAPTVLAHGTDRLRAKYIKRILTGEDQWCQLFSEPGAGSDAAASQTRAEKHGDEWIVNGQKVWTSGAQTSKYGMLLCRTDWDKPKHEGLSYFVIDMQQPGVEVRPLRQMTGGASFNEVFFNDARIPGDEILGDYNGGWAVAVTTLMNERVSIGGGGVRVGTQGQQQMSEEQRRQFASMMNRANPTELAKQTGRSGDRVVRQELAQLYILQKVSGWNNQRSRAAAAKGGRPGPEGSLAKLMGSHIARTSARITSLVAGAPVMLSGSDSPLGPGLAMQQLSYHSSSIAGGTDDIQRNIIGERVLGLPKDPQIDAGIPFRDVQVNRYEKR